MKFFYYPTIIATFGYMIMLFSLIVPEKKYDQETGEVRRKFELSGLKIFLIISLIITALISLYTINCLNFNFHLFDNKPLISEKDNLFTRDYRVLNKQQINQLYKQKLAPKTNCIYISWLIAFFVLIMSIVLIIIKTFKNPKKQTIINENDQ